MSMYGVYRFQFARTNKTLESAVMVMFFDHLIFFVSFFFPSKSWHTTDMNGKLRTYRSHQTGSNFSNFVAHMIPHKHNDRLNIIQGKEERR